MNSQLAKIFQGGVIAILAFQLIGCGTLLYPERKGQKTGRLDLGIVALDAIGLLLFLVPGVIAFAVDFSNGTIYLPESSAALREIHFDPKTTDAAGIERIIREETGHDVRLKGNGVQVTRLGSYEEMAAHFARNQTLGETGRIAYLR